MTEQQSETPAPRRGRPPASSREEIESVALELFLRKGFEETTLAEITAGAGVSKTSFFRYFPSKSSIVWWRFDEYTSGFAELLDAAVGADGPTLELVRSCIRGALEKVLDPQGFWIERFRVLETSSELRSGQSEQWAEWSDHVATFVARRHGMDPLSVPPQAIAGAIHAAYISVLRSWLAVDTTSSSLLPGLDESLQPLCTVLQGWLDSSPA